MNSDQQFVICRTMSYEDIQALRHLLGRAQHIVSARAEELPAWHADRIREVLTVAVALTDDLLSTAPAAFLRSLPNKPYDAQSD